MSREHDQNKYNMVQQYHIMNRTNTG